MSRVDIYSRVMVKLSCDDLCSTSDWHCHTASNAITGADEPGPTDEDVDQWALMGTNSQIRQIQLKPS